MVDKLNFLSSPITPLSAAVSDNKTIDKLPPPSALFNPNEQYDFVDDPDAGRSLSGGSKPFILPPPSSLPGFQPQLPPSSNVSYHYQPQYYYPSPTATTAPPTPVNKPRKAANSKRRDEETTATEAKKRAKKSNGVAAIKTSSTNNDDVSAAAAALASFATSPTVNEFVKKDIVPDDPYRSREDQQSVLIPAPAPRKKRTYVTKKQQQQQQQQQQLESNQILEAARILMDISRCVVRPVSVAH